MELHGIQLHRAETTARSSWTKTVLAAMLPYSKELVAVGVLLLLFNFTVFILPVGLTGFRGDGDVRSAAHFSRAVGKMHHTTANPAAAAAAAVQIRVPNVKSFRGGPWPSKASSTEPASAAAAAGAGTQAGGVGHGGPADLAWWTVEARGVIAHYLGDSFKTGCERTRCVPHFAAAAAATEHQGHLYCCDGARAPVAVVLRDDLVRHLAAPSSPQDTAAAVRLNVSADGRMTLWARPVTIDTALSCDALAAIPGLSKDLRPPSRCRNAPPAPLDKVARALPFYVVYGGVGGAPVCVSPEGRVRQFGLDGFLLGDELGRPCTAVSDIPAPNDTSSAAAQAGAAADPAAARGGRSDLPARLVVLTQPWAHIHVHWITEAFMRLGATWELVAGHPETRVHVPNNNSRVLLQLSSVGVRPDQMVVGNVCAREVVVPMVSNCGQPISALALHLRQLTWLYMNAGASARAPARPPAVTDIWSVRAPTPSRLVLVVISRSTGRMEQYDALVDFLRDLAAPTLDIVEVPADPADPAAMASMLASLRNASAIVAIHGAGLAFSYVCRPGTLVLDVLVPRAVRMLASRIAQAVGLDYHGILPAGAVDSTSERHIRLLPADFALIDGILRARLPALGTHAPTSAASANDILPVLAPQAGEDDDARRAGEAAPTSAPRAETRPPPPTEDAGALEE